MPDQRLGGRIVGHCQLHQRRVESLLAQDLARDLHAQCGRQRAGRMRLHDHRIAGGQRGEQVRIGVPRGEGRAADHHRHAAARHFIVLGHRQRRVLSLRLFPMRICGDEAHLAVRVGHRFEAAVLRMRAARLESHHPALATGQHDGLREFEAALVQPSQDFETHTGASVDAKLAPGRHRRLAGCHQRVDVAHRVLDVDRDPVRRTVGASPAGHAGLAEVQPRAGQRRDRPLAVFHGGLAVDLGAGHLGVRAPVAAAGDGLQGAVERGAVGVEQGVRHVFSWRPALTGRVAVLGRGGTTDCAAPARGRASGASTGARRPRWGRPAEHHKIQNYY